MILAGFIMTIAGVILYCGVCFAGGMDAEMGNVLFRNAVPVRGATLAVLGLGTLVWLAGSVTFLRGAMDADEAAAEAQPRRRRIDRRLVRSSKQASAALRGSATRPRECTPSIPGADPPPPRRRATAQALHPSRTDERAERRARTRRSARRGPPGRGR